jgi:Mn2+/Fe2+ NRAMP family transporter
MRSVLAYSAARVVLFAATVGVLFLLGARGLLLFAVAVLVSGLVSFVLLSRQRDAMSSAVVSGVRDRRRRFDEAIEAARSREDPPEPTPRS